jgi:hypothetical protein
VLAKARAVGWAYLAQASRVCWVDSSRTLGRLLNKYDQRANLRQVAIDINRHGKPTRQEHENRWKNRSSEARPDRNFTRRADGGTAEAKNNPRKRRPERQAVSDLDARCRMDAWVLAGPCTFCSASMQKNCGNFFMPWASTNLIKKTPINESFTDRSSVNKVRKALGATLIEFSGLSSTAFSHTLRIVYGCSRTEGHSSTIATHPRTTCGEGGSDDKQHCPTGTRRVRNSGITGTAAPIDCAGGQNC